LQELTTELQPEPEAIGLLSLVLLQESRRAVRTSPTGVLTLLEEQDRSLCNREQIAEGVALVEKTLKSGRFGSYTLQAGLRQFIGRRDRALRRYPSGELNG
jgi:RNA polymerase sigma-70 factor, ECF subfamily